MQYYNKIIVKNKNIFEKNQIKMLNEKKKIMKAKIKNNDIKNSEIFMNLSNNINIFYSDLLSHVTQSLWWHCSSILLQYLHLIFFTVNQNVSTINKSYIYILVYYNIITTKIRKNKKDN